MTRFLSSVVPLLHLLFVVLLMIGATTARMAYEFPAGAETLLSEPLDTSFSCDDRIYGYYADVANNCEVFHVCLPISHGEAGGQSVAHFSFVCGNTTVFSQESLTCVHPFDAMPCEQSESLYELTNSEFGRISREDQE